MGRYTAVLLLPAPARIQNGAAWTGKSDFRWFFIWSKWPFLSPYLMVRLQLKYVVYHYCNDPEFPYVLYSMQMWMFPWKMVPAKKKPALLVLSGEYKNT